MLLVVDLSTHILQENQMLELHSLDSKHHGKYYTMNYTCAFP